MVWIPPSPIPLENPENAPPRSAAAPGGSENPENAPPRSAAAPSGSASENPRPRRQVSKFTDDYGVVTGYCGYFDFELDENFDYTKNVMYEDEEDSNHVVNPRETLIRYVNQIRKSFGFDVDCVPPSWFNGTLTYIDLDKAMSSGPRTRDFILKLANYAVAEISVETGKNYELVKVEKAVSAHLFTLFTTLRVKEVAVDGRDEDEEEEKIIQAIASQVIASEEMELFQWRYKPDEEDVWFELPPLIPRRPLDSHSEDV